MKIWTTKKLKELFFQDYDDIICVDSESFETEYIKKSGIVDIAVYELNKDYLAFLSNKKLKGIEGTTIFCDFRRGLIENLDHYNAIVLDVNKIGIDGCREIIKFVVHFQRDKYKPLLLYQFGEINIPKQSRDTPLFTREEIINAIQYPYNNRQSLIISYNVQEDGKNVTARATCQIKDIRQNYFVVEKIKPIFALNGLVEDTFLKVIFPAKEIHYEGVCLLRSIKDEMLYIDFPEKLFIERRRHLRIEPSVKKPVYIYVYIPEESSDPFEVLDISLQGASFISERDLSETGVYTFALWITDMDVVIMAAGVVRYKQAQNSKFKYGMEFQISEKDQEKVSNYIRKREIEILQNLKQLSNS